MKFVWKNYTYTILVLLFKAVFSFKNISKAILNHLSKIALRNFNTTAANKENVIRYPMLKRDRDIERGD